MKTYQFAEYETRILDCPPPTPADKRLAAALAARGEVDARIDIDWLEGGQLKVRTTSWVGVVRFSGIEIRIVPKLVGGTLRVLRMIQYCGGVPLLTRLPTDRPLPANGDDLFDLLVLLLTEETKALIRDGLIRDYHPVDDSLDVLRGRMRIRDQLLRRYGQLHQIDCTYDEFDGDIPENQLLAAALQSAAPRTSDDTVRTNARMIAAMINQVCQPPTHRADWYTRNIHYGRRNARYKSAHTLATLILQGLALDDHPETSTTDITSFMVDMNTLFETFITHLVVNALAGTTLAARAQKSLRAIIIDEESGHTYSTIRPDLIIEDTTTGDAVPIDVKYKLYDSSKKISAADIYQSFVYAYSLTGHADDPRAGLIYPGTETITGPVLRIKPLADAKPARVRGAGVDVPATLDALGTQAQEAIYEQIRATIRELTGLTLTTEFLLGERIAVGQSSAEYGAQAAD